MASHGGRPQRCLSSLSWCFVFARHLTQLEERLWLSTLPYSFVPFSAFPGSRGIGPPPGKARKIEERDDAVRRWVLVKRKDHFESRTNSVITINSALGVRIDSSATHPVRRSGCFNERHSNRGSSRAGKRGHFASCISQPASRPASFLNLNDFSLRVMVIASSALIALLCLALPSPARSRFVLSVRRGPVRSSRLASFGSFGRWTHVQRQTAESPKSSVSFCSYSTRLNFSPTPSRCAPAHRRRTCRVREISRARELSVPDLLGRQIPAVSGRRSRSRKRTTTTLSGGFTISKTTKAATTILYGDGGEGTGGKANG